MSINKGNRILSIVAIESDLNRVTGLRYVFEKPMPILFVMIVHMMLNISYQHILYPLYVINDDIAFLGIIWKNGRAQHLF